MIQEVVIDFVFSTKIIILIIKQVAYIITAMSAATVWLYMFALNHTFFWEEFIYNLEFTRCLSCLIECEHV